MPANALLPCPMEGVLVVGARRYCFPLAAFLSAASPVHAGELFGGIYAHDVDTPWTRKRAESGADMQFGWRGGRIGHTPLQPYAFVSINTAGQTHFGAVGLSAKFGDRVFVRPGLGIAVHTGSTADRFDPSNEKIEFGSGILFEPEIGVGARLTERLSIEASLVHMSHAQLFSQQNPGIFALGVRLNCRLP